PDSSDVLHVDANSVSGLAAGVTLNGDSLSVDPNAYDHLAVGEHATVTRSEERRVGKGGSVAQSATSTITGANDQPAVAAAITSTHSEDDAPYSVNLLTGASDPDSSDVLHVDANSVSGLAAGVTLNGDSLSVDPNAYDHLAVGEHATVTVNYNVVDGNGGSVAQSATITITGANDQPAVSAAISSTHSENGARYSVSLLAGSSDPDSSDVLHVDANSVSGLAAGVTLNGHTLFPDPTPYRSLAVGEHATVTVNYNVVDGNGGSVAQSATITITGANDQPAVSAAISSTPSEDDASYSVNLLTAASAHDSTHVPSVDPNISSGLPAGVTLHVHSRSRGPTAHDRFPARRSAALTVNYNVVDGNGGSVAQSATITITGANDQPAVSAAITSTASEDDASYSVNLLTGASDPDSSDVLHVDANSVSGLAAGVTLNGDSLSVDPNAYDHLAVGEHATVTV